MRRLWCAAAPLPDARSVERCGAASLAAVAAVARELVRGAEAATLVPTGQNRVYSPVAGLPGRCATRRSSRPRAARRGFAVVEVANLAFPEQVRLLRHAELAIVQDRDDCVLAWFARAGTRLCCLAHPDGAPGDGAVRELAQLGIELVVLPGVAAEDPGPERTAFASIPQRLVMSCRAGRGGGISGRWRRFPSFGEVSL